MAWPSSAELVDVIAAAAEAEDTSDSSLHPTPGQLPDQLLVDFDSELPVELNYTEQLAARVITEYYETHTAVSYLLAIWLNAAKGAD